MEEVPFGHGIKTQSPTFNTTIKGNLIINCSANALWVFGYNNYIVDNQYAKTLGIEAGVPDNPPIGEKNVIEGNQKIVVTEDISPFQPSTDRNPPHLDPIVSLIPVSVIVAAVVLSVLLFRRHRKTAN